MPSSFAEFGEFEWKVFHAIQDVQRGGETLNEDLLVEALADVDAEKRETILKMVRGDLSDVSTDDSDAVPGGLETDSRTFNIALYRVMHGLPGTITHLSELTGLTTNAIKCRIHKVRHQYTDEEIRGREPGELDRTEHASICRTYGGMANPAVREFVKGLNSGFRSHPDHRTRNDWRNDAA